jgi:ABC-2 type transport system permease protein
MVAHLVRLKLTLLRNGLRRSAWQVVGLVVAVLYAVGIVALAVAGLVALSTQNLEVLRLALVLGGALMVLGWWVVPLVAFGVDATVDPVRFVMFPIPRRTLVVGLAVAGLIGVPGAATTIISATTVVSWWRHPEVLVVAAFGAALGLALCVVGSRATTTVLAPLVMRRRFRELATIAAVVPFVVIGPVMSVVGERLEGTEDIWPGVSRVVGWTPFGAPWAMAADVAEGAHLDAALKAVIGLGTLALLVVAWSRGLDAALVRGPGTGEARSRTRGLGFFDRFPGTPTGAVAARCLTYWVRDPRYAAGIAIVPLLPVVIWYGSGGGWGMLALGPVVAYLMGWTVSADVAYDGTPFWTHVAAPISGRVDRAGRVWATGLLGLPMTLVLTLISLQVSGRWWAALPVLGSSLGVLATALGVASVLSARLVYQVPKAGESPFSTAQGGATAGMVSQLIGTAAVAALILPTAALTVAALVTASVLLGVLACVVGVSLGAVVLVLGVRLGGDLYDRRAPELLERLVAFA